jgi:hypothetical protein
LDGGYYIFDFGSKHFLSASVWHSIAMLQVRRFDSLMASHCIIMACKQATAINSERLTVWLPTQYVWTGNYCPSLRWLDTPTFAASAGNEYN